jgi:hypothetical protein
MDSYLLHRIRATIVLPRRRAERLVLVSSALLASGCLIDLDAVKEPVMDGDGDGAGGMAAPAGGMGGSPGDGGSPLADGGSPQISGGSGGGTGGESEPAYGPNLITNGDFSSGTTGWDNGGLTPAPPPVQNGMGCTSDGGHMTPPDQFIGWSGGTSGTTLEAGTYRYEFRMLAIGSPNIEVKIASTVPPNYEPWLLRAQLSPASNSEDSYVYEFDVASAQSQMGLLFNAKDGVGQACVDDVSLRRVLAP